MHLNVVELGNHRREKDGRGRHVYPKRNEYEYI